MTDDTTLDWLNKKLDAAIADRERLRRQKPILDDDGNMDDPELTKARTAATRKVTEIEKRIAHHRQVYYGEVVSDAS